MELPIIREAMYQKASIREIRDNDLGDELESGKGPYIALRHDGDIIVSCYRDTRLGAMGNTVRVKVDTKDPKTSREWTMTPLFNDDLRDDEEIIALFEYVIRSINRMSPEKVNDWCRSEGFN